MVSDTLYIYIDESGDLGKHGSKFFSVVALSTENPKPIRNFMGKVKRRKLSKKMLNLSELKGNNSDEIVRKYVLKNLAKKDCWFDIITVTKEQILEKLYNNKERLYNYILGLLITNSDLKSYKNFQIVVDKKSANNLLQKDLNSYIGRKIHEKKLLFSVNIRHLESHAEKCLQAVDFVAWSTNRKYSHGEDCYYKMIEERVSSFDKLWR